MNWNELSNIQADLDLKINLEKQLNHSTYIREKAIALCVELGELMNERPFIFKYWSNKFGDREKALTEYVDGIHFIVSYGNSKEFDFTSYEYKRPKECDQRDLILGLFNMFATLPYNNDIETVLNHYWFLGEKLNFTPEEIKQAYLEKVEVNKERQANGY